MAVTFGFLVDRVASQSLRAFTAMLWTLSSDLPHVDLKGWALFRFPPPLHVRNGLLLVIPVVYFALIFMGGATGQMALPHAWAYGVLAGTLTGGRYWSGSRLGQPRPPFNGPGSATTKAETPAKVETEADAGTSKPDCRGGS